MQPQLFPTVRTLTHWPYVAVLALEQSSCV